MNFVIAIALGGALGATLRFLISTGVHQWLGRGFALGTLSVNIIGSFLLGLMTEALLLQRVILSAEYRSAILIGLLGSLTTFSTFSLETLYLIEQGQLTKAGLNIILNVLVCLFAVWIGLLIGRGLFSVSDGILRWIDWVLPYALLSVNTFGAFLIGLISTILLNKTTLPTAYNSGIMIGLAGIFIASSSHYLVLNFIEHDYHVKTYSKSIYIVIFCNIVICSTAMLAGVFIAKKI